jgi:hypothetical protein
MNKARKLVSKLDSLAGSVRVPRKAVGLPTMLDTNERGATYCNQSIIPYTQLDPTCSILCQSRLVTQADLLRRQLRVDCVTYAAARSFKYHTAGSATDRYAVQGVMQRILNCIVETPCCMMVADFQPIEQAGGSGPADGGILWTSSRPTNKQYSLC